MLFCPLRFTSFVLDFQLLYTPQSSFGFTKSRFLINTLSK